MQFTLRACAETLLEKDVLKAALGELDAGWSVLNKNNSGDF
jgi:hypothetical protein